MILWLVRSLSLELFKVKTKKMQMHKYACRTAKYVCSFVLKNEVIAF